MIISRHFIFLAATLLALTAYRSSASAYDVTSDAWIPASQAPKQVLPRPPMRLGWNSSDKAFWVTGESPEPSRDASGQVVFASGMGTLGARTEIFRSGGVSLTAVPLIRAEASWQEQNAGARQALGAAIFEELSIALPASFRFRAKGGFGDRIGVSAPNPGGVSPGLAIRGEAGLSGNLASLGHANTRFDLQLISTQAFGTGTDDPYPRSTCELKLELLRKGTAPLSIAGSCPGAAGEGRITLNIGGRF
ncbi:MAG TPA: hypothetical protein VIL69_01930 [Roseomonas sp.]|jgi:hypothetical protein